MSPRNSTIVLGSSIEITSSGGPHPDVNIVFSVQNENILCKSIKIRVISSAHRNLFVRFISAMDLNLAKGIRLGKTIIIGRCIGINPSNSQQIIFSEDQIEINVVLLNEVKIQIPLRRVQSGTVLPASIWGVPNISPLILGKQ